MILETEHKSQNPLSAPRTGFKKIKTQLPYMLSLPTPLFITKLQFQFNLQKLPPSPEPPTPQFPNDPLSSLRSSSAPVPAPFHPPESWPSYSDLPPPPSHTHSPFQPQPHSPTPSHLGLQHYDSSHRDCCVLFCGTWKKRHHSKRRRY